MEQKNEKKSVWGVLLKVIIAVASALVSYTHLTLPTKRIV